MLTIFYAFMDIFYYRYSIVFAISIFTVKQLRLRETVFEMQLTFQVWSS